MIGELHYMLRADRFDEHARQHILLRMTELAIRFAPDVRIEQDADDEGGVLYLIVRLALKGSALQGDAMSAAEQQLRTVRDTLERSCEHAVLLDLVCCFECSMLYDCDEAPQ